MRVNHYAGLSCEPPGSERSQLLILERVVGLEHAHLYFGKSRIA